MRMACPCWERHKSANHPAARACREDRRGRRMKAGLAERQSEGFYRRLRRKMVIYAVWTRGGAEIHPASTTISCVRPSALGGKWLMSHPQIAHAGSLSSKQGWPKPARRASARL